MRKRATERETERVTHTHKETESEKDRLRKKILHKLATLFSVLAEAKYARTIDYMYTLTVRFLQTRKHVHA